MKKILLLSMLFALPAMADTGLVMTASAPGQAASATARAWVRPVPGLYVLSYPTPGATVTWGDPQLQFREWSSIPATYGISNCPTDIPQGVFSDVDPCGNDAKPLMVKTAVVLATPPVTAVAGKVTVQWNAPTANTDGSALTDLAGFYVYQGTSPTSLARLATTLGAGARSLADLPLPVGTFYFAVSAYNTGGSESAQSAPVSVVIDKPAPKKVPGAPTQFKATITLTLP